MEYRKTEIRAGVFILTAFLLAVVLIFTVSDLQGIFKGRHEYTVLFSSNEGLEKNANVRMSGIRIGRVSGMRIVPELGSKVQITLSVFDDTVIKEDATVSIKTLGLVGKKYIDVAGGSPEARPLKPGAVLTGEESFKMEDLARMAMEVAGRLKNVAVSIEKVIQNVERTVGDPALAQSLKASVRNLQDVTENVKVMTSGKEEVAQSLKGLPDIIKKIEDAANNLKAVTEKSDKLVGENRKNVDAMLEGFRDMARNLKEATDDVKANPWKLLRKP